MLYCVCMCGFAIALETMMFQVLQLTALVIRGPATHGERFYNNIDCVPIKEEEVRGVLLCVQVFVRTPHFTLRSFFSESSSERVSESVAIANSIAKSSFYAPWSLLGTTCADQVLSDLCACWDRVVLRGRTVKIPVSVDIMLAPLELKRHQVQGCKIQM